MHNERESLTTDLLLDFIMSTNVYETRNKAQAADCICHVQCTLHEQLLYCILKYTLDVKMYIVSLHAKLERLIYCT